MNDNEFNLAARDWLEDGPTRMSDHAVLSALEEIHTTRQRRALWPAWRATPVSIFARVATAAVLVVAVGLLAINVIPRLPDGSSVGGPSPSPSAAGTVDFPDLTTTFVSPRNGFSIKHPDRVALTPAEQLWGFSKQVDDGFDVVETGLGAVFKGASTNSGFGDGGSIDEWADQYVLPGGCGVPRSQQAEITIDGQSGRIAECPNHIEATVIFGGRLYLFTLSHDRSDARAVFDAFVATIDLTPETAVDFPAMTTTFVSPTYGYSFKYHDRGGPPSPPTPATELWNPGNQPLDERNLPDRFDGEETGMLAYFEGASTQIPDGVSIDEWVDEYVTPTAAGGCGVPRSQQPEITIDGQSGRIAECDHTEATVVAGGRLYIFILFSDRTDPRAWFDAWIATIDLTPETAAPVPYSMLDGEVTFAAAPPWGDTILERTFTVLGGVGRGSASQFTMFTIVADPLTFEMGCEAGPVPADAEALAQSIRSNPDLEATAPVVVSVGGIDALQMDVVAAPGASDCGPMVIDRLSAGQDGPMRLYLLDLPEGMSARILAIAISALESEFEHVVEAAAPIMDSFEFHRR